MKINIRILSQQVLSENNTKRLRVYGSADVNLPEPITGNDANTIMMRWWYSYQRILAKDPTAVMKVVPHVLEQNLCF